MIKLTKLPKPQILVDNEEVWTDEFRRLRAGDESVPKVAKFRYRHEEIKTTLKVETYAKCAYCESKMLHVTPGQIEHIYPVAARPDLIVAWTNLTLACEECNRRKGAYYNESEPLIHPYDDEPDSHVIFVGPLVLHAPGDMKGYRTHRTLELSRSELFERKKERIEEVQRLVDQWQNQPDGPTKELLRKQILIEAQPSKEFSATIRAYLKQALDWNA